MDNRERIIRLWFDMWLTKKDLGIFNVFSEIMPSILKVGGQSTTESKRR